jgi:ABC-type glutathione transport system ATPase component
MKRIALRHLAKTDHGIYSKMIHMSLLDVRNLTVDLLTAAGWIRPVNEVSFQLAPAESLGPVGESGSGKTMLALALMGLLPPGARVAGPAVLKRGEMSERNLTQLNEKAWRAVRGREIAMVFQEPMTSLNPVMRIGAQIGEGIPRIHKRLTGPAIPQTAARIGTHCDERSAKSPAGGEGCFRSPRIL